MCRFGLHILVHRPIYYYLAYPKRQMINVFLSVLYSLFLRRPDYWKLSVRENYELNWKWIKGLDLNCELSVQTFKWRQQSLGSSSVRPQSFFKPILWFLFTLLLFLFHSLSFLLHPLFLRQLQLPLHRGEPVSSLRLSSCPSRLCLLFQLKTHRHALSYLNSTLVYSRSPFGTLIVATFAMYPERSKSVSSRYERKIRMNISRLFFIWKMYWLCIIV